MNPTQEKNLETLKGLSKTETGIKPEHIKKIRTQLETCFTEISEQTDDLFLSKHVLNLLAGCEGYYIASQNTPFEWSVPIAKGTIAHKALELSIVSDHCLPLELVETAIERLIDANVSISTFLVELTPGEKGDLVNSVNDTVSTFFETFPPIKKHWRPVCETKIRYQHQNITLAGQVDLTLGGGGRKQLVDYKTGKLSETVLGDLRFYSLVEALRTGVAPRAHLVMFLDSGQMLPELVTLDTLTLTADRVMALAQKSIKIDGMKKEEINLIPSAKCSWCPAAESCETGQKYLAQQNQE